MAVALYLAQGLPDAIRLATLSKDINSYYNKSLLPAKFFPIIQCSVTQKDVVPSYLVHPFSPGAHWITDTCQLNNVQFLRNPIIPNQLTSA